MSDEVAVEETPEVLVDETRDALVASLSAELGDGLVESYVKPGDDVWIRVTRDAWVDTANTLKSAMGFGYFNFLSAIDWQPSPFGRDLDSQVDVVLNPPDDADDQPDADSDVPLETGYAGGDTRFQLFARLNDITTERAVTIKCDLPLDDLSAPTWVPTYPGANWHEREVAEMFGIHFVGHSNLRNLYLPEMG